MDNILSKIPQRYWAYLVLAVWGALTLMLLHKTPYGIDEGAAHALLLVWSVVDNVASPIVTLGLPDFRAIFLAPAGFLWTGSVIAAKVTSIIVMAVVVWAMHAWRRDKGDEEGGRLATGLLMLSPLVLGQIDSVSVAPYLLFTFAMGAWLNKIYRKSPMAFGAGYFTQLFLCMLAASLHPAGLAYPMLLLWSWYKSPLDAKHRNYFIGGVSFVTLLALVLTAGWSHIAWFANPLFSLSRIFLGYSGADETGVLNWVVGFWMLLAVVLVIWRQWRNLSDDFLGRILLAALVIGLIAGDVTFAIIALSLCLYWGLPLLFGRPKNTDTGFWGQRGLALLIVTVVSTAFMMVDKQHYQFLLSGEVTPRDALIRALVEENNIQLKVESRSAGEPKRTIRVASQWPGPTMLACGCDALPLPPDAKDGDALLAMLRGVDYLMFNPRTPENSSLSHNLATMGAGKVETLALQQGGVIVGIKHAPTPVVQ